jgi:type I restriction enzyme S subunit
MWGGRKTLSEVCTNLDNMRVPITKKDRVEGSYPYYGASGIVDYVDDYIFDEDLLLVSEDGANLLARTYPIAFSASGKYWVNNHAHALKFESSISQQFIEYYLNSISLADFISGMAQPKLNQRALNSIPVPFPPLETQKQIVAKLDQAFADIEKAKVNAEKNLINATELFENHLERVFRTSNESWRSTVLGELCEKMEYGTSSKSLAEGNTPVLRMGNLQNGKLDWNNLKYSDVDDEIEKYDLKTGDVLFNRTNSAEHVGKAAIYDGKQPAIFAGYLIRIHRKKDLLDSTFLNYYLNSKFARDYGKTVMSQSVNQANINGTKLKQYPISVPSLSEQQVLSRRMSSLESEIIKLKNIYMNKLLALEELKQSILQQAFNGELR